MSRIGKLSTMRTVHGALQSVLDRVVGLEIELAKAVSQFGDSDPLVARLREQLERAESQLRLAESLYEKEVGKL